MTQIATPEAVSTTITAQNQFTGALTMLQGEVASIRIRATAMSATITLQTSDDGGTNWDDVEAFTAPDRQSFYADERCLLRIGCKTGGFTSATALNVRLGKG